MFIVSVDRSKCEGCGECVDACPVGILGMTDCTRGIINFRSVIVRNVSRK